MTDDHQSFLRLLNQPPARLTSEQVAWALGFQPHDIPILTDHGLLRPLGKPIANMVKYFATTEVLKMATDRAWLSKATQVMNDHWRHKNTRKMRET